MEEDFEGSGDSDELLSLQLKVSHLENQLAETIRQHSEETGGLHNQLVHLNTQLEHSLAENQRLEYGLTLAQKVSRQTRLELEEKVKEWSNVQASLQDRIAKLTRQCREWQNTLNTVQQARGKEQTLHKQQITEKEEELMLKGSQYEELVSVKEQLNIELSTEQSLVAELQNRQQQLEAELSRKNDLELQLEHDLQDTTDRERQLQRELQVALKKTTALQSDLESQCSRLQEVQFSLQMSQHRVKEVECHLEEEKAAHREAKRSLDRLKESMSGMKSSLKSQERKNEMVNEQLQSKQLECQKYEQQASQHQAVISDLSHQLQLCKNNFDSLKEELTLAKHRQLMVEETYTSCLREVDSLIGRFESRLTKTHTKGHRTKDAVNSTPDPTHLPEKLRLVLTEFTSQFDSLNSQLQTTRSLLSSSKESMKQLSLECSTYREVVTSRTAAMTEAEKQLGASAKELTRLKSEVASFKVISSSLEQELNTLREREEEGRMKLSERKEELSSLQRKYTNDNEIHCRFLQLLNDQLSIKRTSTPTLQSHLHTGDGHGGDDQNQTNWINLSSSLQTSLLAHIEAFRRAKREIKQHKSTIASLKSTLETSEAMHRESVDKLTLCSEEQERQWTQRNVELKSHYERLFVEGENRNQELERRLSQAAHRGDEVTSLKKSLEEELLQLKEVHRGYKNDRACLLACTCLLAGSLYPILQKMEQLSEQKSTLLRHLSRYRKLERQVSHVVNSIQMALSQDSQSESCTSLLSEDAPSSLTSLKKHPLLRFRKAVIVVLAVNRFHHFHTHSTLLFKAPLPPSTTNTHLETLSVHLGLLTKGDTSKKHKSTISSKTTTSIAHDSRSIVPSNKDVASWLRSEKVLTQVRESFKPLQSKLDACAPHHYQQSSSASKRNSKAVQKFDSDDYKSTLVLPTSECFSEALEKMSSHFAAQRGNVFVSQMKGSLCVKLREGLEAVLRRKVHGFVSCKELGESLHTQLSNLIGQLHQAQVDLHSTRSQLKHSEKRCEKLNTTCELNSKVKAQVEAQVASLQLELREMVPRSQLEEVCHELEASVGRERDVRMSLSQHVTAVQQLQERLQMAGQDVLNKETSLSMATKELNDLRLSLQHKDHQLSLVGKQLKLVEGERMAQAQQVGELQTALAQYRREMMDEVFSESFERTTTARLSSSPSAHGHGVRSPATSRGLEKNGFVPLREQFTSTSFREQDRSTST